MDELDKIHRILDNVFYQNCCSYFEIYLSSHLVLYTTAEYARYASSLGTQGERPWLVGRDLTGPEHREAIWHPSSGMSYAVDQMDIEKRQAVPPLILNSGHWQTAWLIPISMPSNRTKNRSAESRSTREPFRFLTM